MSLGKRPEDTQSPATVGLFMGFMHEKGYAPSSINSALSAISFVYKWRGQADPTNCFYVRSLQKGLGKFARPDKRQAISINDLKIMIQMLSGHDDRIMLSCIFSMAFFGLFRMGELVGSGNHVLMTENLRTDKDGIHITLPTYKHSKRPALILLKKKDSETICPVRAVEQYISTRPLSTAKQFFLCRTGKPISMVSVGKLVKELGMRMQPTRSLNGHSFRIGGATQAAIEGLSDDEIKRLGRWESGAFTKYLRGEISN